MRMSRHAKGETEVLAILVGGILIVLGALIGYTLAFARPLPTAAWVGFALVIIAAFALSGFAYLLVVRSDRPAVEPLGREAPGNGVLRILVVADEAIGSDRLRNEVCERALGCESEVLVVAPALNTPIRHWTDDEEKARAGARQRLDEELRLLAELGVRARGEVGADDPLQAVDDALRTFAANEIVISTHPLDRMNWLEEGVVGRVREAYRLPVTHVVVD